MTYLSENYNYNAEDFIKDLNAFKKDVKYGRHDGQSPVEASMIRDNSNYCLSARNMWTLLRLFPLIISRHKFKDEAYIPYVRHLVELHEIHRIIYSTEFPEWLISLLSKKIERYLRNYKGLYNRNIPPKMHYLIHYCSAIMLFGPPRYYATFRFESKNQCMKAINTATHNTINPPYSIAKRHQYQQSYYLLSPNYFIDMVPKRVYL